MAGGEGLVDLDPDDFVEELFRASNEEEQEAKQEEHEQQGVQEAAVLVIDSDDEGTSSAVVAVEAPKAKVQYSLRSFFQGVKETPGLQLVAANIEGSLVETLVEEDQARLVLHGEDGGGAGMLGGRPRVLVEDKRGAAGLEDKANRLHAGQKRRRFDWDPQEALKMIDYMKSRQKEFAEETSFWREMVRRYRPTPKKILQGLLRM